MNQSISVKDFSPRILVARDYPEKLVPNSEVLASFHNVYIPEIYVSTIVNWVQRHQPDLIVLDIEYSKIIDSGLVSALRLDWLTRQIPIVVISNVTHDQAIKNGHLDCDAYLAKPCSSTKLETTICSFVQIPPYHNLIAGF